MVPSLASTVDKLLVMFVCSLRVVILNLATSGSLDSYLSCIPAFLSIYLLAQL